MIGKQRMKTSAILMLRSMPKAGVSKHAIRQTTPLPEANP